jgi:hypothetical protein
VTIDLDLLNDLFENQKKLDDAFNSVFDDDSFLSDLKGIDTNTPSSSAQQKNQARSDTFVVPESRGMLHMLVPVALEIALICYGISYFS